MIDFAELDAHNFSIKVGHWPNWDIKRYRADHQPEVRQRTRHRYPCGAARGAPPVCGRLTGTTSWCVVSIHRQREL